MAQIVTTVKRFIGTAAERAAMSEADRNATPAGSTYLESDTGLLYVLDNETPRVWQPKVTNIDGSVTAQLTGSSAAAFESLSVDDSVTELTAGTYGTATAAMISVEDHSMRYRVDGGDPTDAIGHLVDDGDTIILATASDIANFKAIRTTGDDAEIEVTYYE